MDAIIGYPYDHQPIKLFSEGVESNFMVIENTQHNHKEQYLFINIYIVKGHVSFKPKLITSLNIFLILITHKQEYLLIALQ